MKVGLVVILALIVGALAAHLVLADNGYVLVNFRGYVIETSVPILALVLVLGYLTVRVLVQVWRAPRRLGEAWARARINYAGRQATKGYIALAEGRLARGERLLTRGARQSETPLLNYLAAARAARGRDLGRNHSVQRDARLREEGPRQFARLCAGVRRATG